MNSITSRIVFKSGMTSLSYSRQRLVRQLSHGLPGMLQGFHPIRHPRALNILHTAKHKNKVASRRMTSANVGKNPKSKPNSANETEQSNSAFSDFWKSYLGPKPMPDRWSAAWYREMALICTVFAITGSSTMVLVRPAVSKGLGLQGSFRDGPWSFRICSLVVMTPIYATLLLVVGTVFGRHAYFRHFSVKMWSRFGIPPEMIDKSWHKTSQHFRKW